MKDTESLHKKVQEMCDCYATNDPLKEMSKIKGEANLREAATKWIALAALHGINSNAEKISVLRSRDGNISVIAEYRDTELPSPGKEIGRAVMDAVREIAHIEGDKGKTLLALGIRESNIELQVKVNSEKEGEKVTIKFPNERALE